MTGALLDHLWQSTLFALGAGLLTLTLRNNEARVRYWVWFAASVKFLIPFSLLTLLGSQFDWRHGPAAPAFTESVVNVVQQIAQPLATPEIVMRAPAPAGLSTGLVLLAIWGVGCVALLGRWAIHWMRISATARNATPADIEAPIAVKSTSMLSEPGVVGILRPVLLLPAGIAERLTAAQLQAVLAHELCHVRRRDNLTAAIQMLLEAVFWFHPLIWWIGARMVEERERACDEAVLELGNEPQTYAESILKVCQFYMESKLTCVAGVSGASLKKRVEVIMKNRMAASLTAAKKVLLATTTMAAIAVPVVVGLATSSGATAQATPEAGVANLVFDSATITTPAAEGPSWFFMKEGKLSTQRVPLRMLIAFAYGVDRSRVVGGADWIDKPLYDITATTNNVPAEKNGFVPYGPMVKALLASRFNLLAHPETQQRPVFVLRVDEGGSKLMPVRPEMIPDPKNPGQLKHRPGLLMANSTELVFFVNLLSGMLGRPVVDETGLEGRFDFALTGTYTPETLPAALREQLGLKVEPTTAPLDVIVVDAIQHPTLDAQPAT